MFSGVGQSERLLDIVAIFASRKLFDRNYLVCESMFCYEYMLLFTIHCLNVFKQSLN